MIKQFKQMWRFFGTYLNFSVFGVVGMLLGMVILPVIFIFVRAPGRRKIIARSAIGFSFRWFIWLMKATGVIDYRIGGIEHGIAASNRMIIANHPSLIDVVFLLAIFPMADCVVKKAIVHNPFMLGAVRPADYISNDDTVAFLEDSVNRLTSGASVMMFPEGTRTIPGEPLTFKMGAASIAVRAGSEILPVVIKCSQTGYLSKQKPWYWVPEQKPVFDILIQAPLAQNDLIADAHSQRDATHKLNDALMAYYSAQLD